MNNKSTLFRLVKQHDTESEIFVIGIMTGLLCLIAVGIVTIISNVTGIDMLSHCMFRELLGIYCPGCGGTRSFIYLIHGNIVKSLIYHPFVPYAFVFLCVFYISQTLRYITKERIKGIKFRKIYIIIGITLLTVNWIVKNVLLLCFHIELFH